MLEATTTAVTWVPTEEPTERTTGLKPVAWPVWVGGTEATMRFGMAAKANAIPSVTIVNHVSTAASDPWKAASMPSPKPDSTAPTNSETLWPYRVPSAPDTGPKKNMHTEPGSISRP